MKLSDLDFYSSPWLSASDLSRVELEFYPEVSRFRQVGKESLPDNVAQLE